MHNLWATRKLPTMLVSRNAQRGATLVELIISMALGLSALMALASLVGYGMGLNAKLIGSARLNEELGAVNALMIQDIRRAGFNNATVELVEDPVTNPSEFSNSIALSEFAGESVNSCITYSYDFNSDGTRNAVVGNNENFGFRLRSGIIEMRENGLSCTQDNWEALTDVSVVEVTTLLFSLNQIEDNGVISTEVSITVEGELVADRNLSRRFDSSFVVRNYVQ